MKEVVLYIPTLEAEQNVEIEVKINGKKRRIHYRVEIIAWEEKDEESFDKASYLKKVIREYDKDWVLVQIGVPDDEKIPVMFRKKVS